MPKLSISALVLLLLLHFSILTQTWQTLPNAHYTPTRHEDIHFINANTGWTIYSYSDGIHTYRTTDGGLNWDTTVTPNPPGTNTPFFRCIGFFNSTTGIAGTLTFQRPFYRTTNSGQSWHQVTVHPYIPVGICGISIVDSVTAYAAGAYSGFARILRTTNSGLSWDSVATDTSLIKSIIDIHFWNRDTGIVAGGYRKTGTFQSNVAAIIMTTDGGETWQRVYISNRVGEWCWKISFVSRQIGFVSLERSSGLSYIAKTTNGGLNWFDIPFLFYDQEGIGFLNEQTGWVGGWTGPTYETTSGGLSWHQVPWGFYVNRFRMINDTTAYAVGQTVYKFTREMIGINKNISWIPESFELYQNYPNPFNPLTTIRFSIPAGNNDMVHLEIYDIMGEEIAVLVNKTLKPGTYEVHWDASGYSSGIYYYTLITNSFKRTKKMVLIK